MYYRKEVLEFEMWDEFISAIKTLEEDGKKFSQLVSVHSDMSHNMHTMGNIVQATTGDITVPTGTQRFLPWHRQYLLEFEKLLQSIYPDLYIPYWNWTTNRNIPPRLIPIVLDLTFRFRNRFGNIEIIKTRSRKRNNPINTNALPEESDVKGAVNESKYINFSVEIEGRGIIDDASGAFIPFGRGSAGLHDLVHSIVGGIMGDIKFSPSDPIFWLHHAYCDKIWWDWQNLNPTEAPSLEGQNKILDPWTVSVDEMNDKINLPYGYM